MSFYSYVSFLAHTCAARKTLQRVWVIRLRLVERDRREEYFREPGGKRNFFGCLEELLIRWMIHSSGLPGEADSSRSGPAGYTLYHRRKRKQREIGFIEIQDPKSEKVSPA
jgi:hypothetical protein